MVFIHKNDETARYWSWVCISQTLNKTWNWIWVPYFWSLKVTATQIFSLITLKSNFMIQTNEVVYNQCNYKYSTKTQISWIEYLKSLRNQLSIDGNFDSVLEGGQGWSISYMVDFTVLSAFYCITQVLLYNWIKCYTPHFASKDLFLCKSFENFSGIDYEKH